MLFACLLLILLGLVLFIIGIIKVIDRIKYLTNSKILRGRVINFSRPNPPVIEYVDPYDNSICTYFSNASDTINKVNDIVELRYYKYGNKKIIYLNSFLSIWGAPAMLTLNGAILVFSGILGIVGNQR